MLLAKEILKDASTHRFSVQEAKYQHSSAFLEPDRHQRQTPTPFDKLPHKSILHYPLPLKILKSPHFKLAELKLVRESTLQKLNLSISVPTRGIAEKKYKANYFDILCNSTERKKTKKPNPIPDASNIT